ncbi:MAG TPA: hypothetical protein VF517_17500 [Thermoleophilaceae bacterium]|jgi:hypothetical protein
MALPRPVLIALVGLAALMALFLATRHGAQNESVTPPSTAAKPATTKAPAADKPARPESRQAAAPKAAEPVTPRKPKLDDGVPPQVRKAAEALGRDQVVVFFFTKPGAADDTGARIAVRSIEGMKGVALFKAGIEEVGAYRPMLSQLEISQVPATAIVRPGKKAVLLQGFVDAGTLRQNVADARR